MAPGQGMFTYVRDVIRYMRSTPGASGYGSNATAEEVTSGLDLHACTAVITGPTSGMGLETTRVLAKRGAHIILAARNPEKSEDVKIQIFEETPSARLDFMQLDVASLKSIYKFVADFKSRNLPLNILINNAGAMVDSFQLTEDGIEKTFATNYLGHFLLTKLLLDTMKKTANETGIEGRMVSVSSDGHNFTYPDSVRFEKLQD